MTVDELIRSRRTHKAYDARAGGPRDARGAVRARPLGAEPQPHEPVALPRARPASRWRALKQAAGPEAAAKLDRAPTLVAASVCARTTPSPTRRTTRPPRRRPFIVLLGAHARGLGGYWRTPGVLRTPEGRAAGGIPEAERVLGLVHLGRAKGPDKAAPERAPLDDFRAYLH